MTTEIASRQILKLIRDSKSDLNKGSHWGFYIDENESFDTVCLRIREKKEFYYSLSPECVFILEMQDEGQIESLGQLDIAELLVKQSPHRFEHWKQPLCYYESRIKKVYEKSGIGDKGYLTWNELNMLQAVFKKHLVSQCVEFWKTGEKHFWMDVDRYDMHADHGFKYNYATFYGQSTDKHDEKKELVRFKDGKIEKVYFDHNESNTMTVINALQEWIDNPAQDEKRGA